MAAEEDVVAVDVAVAEETSAVRKPNTGTKRKRVSTRNVRTCLRFVPVLLPSFADFRKTIMRNEPLFATIETEQLTARHVKHAPTIEPPLGVDPAIVRFKHRHDLSSVAIHQT